VLAEEHPDVFLDLAVTLAQPVVLLVPEPHHVLRAERVVYVRLERIGPERRDVTDPREALAPRSG
jgi:hypothetical protein